jgi:CheY-like chemotaxis protein
MGTRRCVLALESDKRNIFELQRAFDSTGIQDRLVVVRHREEALCYLKGVGVYGDRKLYPLPRLMLIDITAEHGAGLDVLRHVSITPELQNILIVATGCGIPSEIEQCAYDLGASAVFEKPRELQELARIIRDLEFLPRSSGDTDFFSQ